MSQQKCTGWWEQAPLGREEMEGLMMQIEGETITGSGYDVVGPFTFEGTLTNQQDVVMIKQYIGQHRVLYKGEYDGGELLWGVWHLQWMSGPWEIRFREGEQEKETEQAAFSEAQPSSIR